MSIKTIELLDNGEQKSPYEDSFFYYLEDYKGSICWAKAYMHPDGRVEMMQSLVSCKDYILDTQWRGQSGYITGKWNKKQQRQNCFFIYIPTDVKFLERIQSFLHPYEEANNLKKTEYYSISKVTPAPEQEGSICDRGLIIRGDDKWNSNGLTWSFYLSLIRALVSAKSASSLDTIFNTCSSNEYGYWNTLTDIGKDFIRHVYNNIQYYFEPIPAKYNTYTGYTTSCGHGATGPFYLSAHVKNMIGHIKTYQQYGYKYPQADSDNYFISKYLEEINS